MKFYTQFNILSTLKFNKPEQLISVSSPIYILRLNTRKSFQRIEMSASNQIKSNDIPVENLRQTKSFDKAPTPIRVAKALCDTLQTAGKRAPPSSTKTTHVRLITIGPSHYCEKARWGLDLLENDPASTLYYTEDAHPPMFHSFASVATSTTGQSMVPALVPDDISKPVLHDSTVILKKYCPFLYPASYLDEVDQMEQDLDRRLGPTVRLMIYYNFFSDKKYDPSMVELMSRNTSVIESFLMDKMLNRGLKEGLKKAMGISDAKAQLSEQIIRDVFEEYSKKLSDGRPYLCKGENVGFTAADLTLAALAGPLIMPKELTPIHLKVEQIPPRLYALKQELRETLAGQHIISIYHKHRFGIGAAEIQTKSSCKNSPTSFRMISIKQGRRNRIPVAGGVVLAAAVAGGAAAILSKM